MTVLDRYVLLKHTLTQKKGIIIKDAAKDDADKFDSTFEVLQKGDKCERKINIGDYVLLARHVSFQAVKIIDPNRKKTIAEVIIYEDDIIAIDDKPVDVDQVIQSALKEEN